MWDVKPGSKKMKVMYFGLYNILWPEKLSSVRAIRRFLRSNSISHSWIHLASESVSESYVQTDDLLFKERPRHPSRFIGAIVKPTRDRALSTEASRLLRLSNEEKLLFLRTIGVARKGECESKFIGSLAAHLLLSKAAIRWGECEECRFIHVPPIFWLETRQKFLKSSLFCFHSLYIDRSGFTMSTNFFKLVSNQRSVAISPVPQFTHALQND